MKRFIYLIVIILIGVSLLPLVCSRWLEKSIKPRLVGENQKYRKKYLLLILLLIVSFASYGQSSQGQAERWKKFRYEIVGGLGVSNYLGDLGGANQIGTNYIKDLEITLTRPAINAAIRYRLTDFTAIKTGFHYGWISGKDALTTDKFRSNRNLHFYSPIFEFSTQLEVFLKRKQFLHEYQLRGSKGHKHTDIYSYVFAGIGGFYFNPKAKYLDGKWYALRPLHTEGQTIFKSRPETYSSIQLCIPAGIGVKYAITERLMLGFELGARKTFTDYLDDVSTTYIDNEIIQAKEGDIAAYFADPSLGIVPGQTTANEQRGNQFNDDIYMFMIFSLNYKLQTERRGMPKILKEDMIVEAGK